MLKFFTVFAFIIVNYQVFAQMGSIMGNVKNKNTQTAIEGVRIAIEKTDLFATTDKDGNFTITSIPVGSYNISAVYTGFVAQTQFNIIVSSGATQFVNFELEKQTNKINGIKVSGSRKQSAVASDVTTPLSVQRLTATEIKSNPGGNFDISKVVQALPGVAGSTGSASFRNDIIIRGGAPNGLAVVPIEREASAGSFIQIPPQKQMDVAARKKVIVDEHSGRILVDADLAREEQEKIEKLLAIELGKA